MTKKKVILTISLWFLVFFTIGQEVTIYTKAGLNPISEALIFNSGKTKTAVSNNKGKANVTSMKNDTLIIQHLSYKTTVISWDELKKNQYLIFLEEKHIHLDPIVLSATKWEQSLSEVPNRMEVLKAEEISIKSPQTTADILEKSNKVYVQKSQYGGGSPMIRGFAANSVLLVMDGVRMNNAIYRAGNLQNIINIDPYLVKSAEIIFGPGTVTYGSDALGGVMDFHLKDPKFGTDSTLFNEMNMSGRYASASQENTGHIDATIGWEKFSMLTSITVNRFDDLKAGSVYSFEDKNFGKRQYYVKRINNKDSMLINNNDLIQKPSGFGMGHFLQKLNLKINDSTLLKYGLYFSATTNIPRYDRLTQVTDDSTLKYAEWYYGPQKWLVNYVKLEQQKRTHFFDEMHIATAHQYYQESRHDRNFNSDALNHRTEDVHAISFKIDFDKEQGKSSFFYGLSANFNNIRSKAEAENIVTKDRTITDTRYPDGINHYYATAIYAAAKRPVTERIKLIGGLRYNRIYLRSTFKDTLYDFFEQSEINNNYQAINGSLGMVYTPNKEIEITGNLSSGFRAPNLDGLGKVFQPSKNTVLVPNENLKPEYAYNADIGIRGALFSFLKINLNGFFTYLHQPMVTRDFTYKDQPYIVYQEDTSNVVAVINAGHAHIYGGSAGIKVTLPGHFIFQNHISYAFGEDDLHDRIRHIPPLFGGMSLEYVRNRYKLIFEFVYNGEITHEKMNSGELDKPNIYPMDENGRLYAPSWNAFHLRSQVLVMEGFLIQAGLENIFDYYYRTYSSGISAPGRNFYIALSLNF